MSRNLENNQPLIKNCVLLLDHVNVLILQVSHRNTHADRVSLVRILTGHKKTFVFSGFSYITNLCDFRIAKACITIMIN